MNKKNFAIDVEPIKNINVNKWSKDINVIFKSHPKDLYLIHVPLRTDVLNSLIDDVILTNKIAVIILDCFI